MNCYKYKEIEIGQIEEFEVVVSMEECLKFKEITGDNNPLHCDIDYAKEKGFLGNVVYGMLTSSYLSTLAGVYLPGKYSLIQSVDLKFLKPVIVGDRLRIIGAIIEKNDTFRFIKIKVNIINQKREKVLNAKMQIGVME